MKRVGSKLDIDSFSPSTATRLNKAEHGLKSSGRYKTRAHISGLDDKKYLIFAKEIKGQEKPKLGLIDRKRFVIVRTKSGLALLNKNSLKRLGFTSKEIDADYKDGVLEKSINTKIRDLIKEEKLQKKMVVDRKRTLQKIVQTKKLKSEPIRRKESEEQGWVYPEDVGTSSKQSKSNKVSTSSKASSSKAKRQKHTPPNKPLPATPIAKKKRPGRHAPPPPVEGKVTKLEE